MTRVQRYRLIGVVCVVAGLGVAALLASQAFRENLMYFYTPSDLLAAESVPDRRLRLGGMDRAGQRQRESEHEGGTAHRKRNSREVRQG